MPLRGIREALGATICVWRDDPWEVALSIGGGLVRERRGEDTYEYYPLGQHVVSAVGVCGGRPTFKYTRIEVAGILQMIAAGESIEAIVADCGRPELSRQAIEEAAQLAAEALVTETSSVLARAA